MSIRPCLEPGCPTLTNATRCKAHTRAKDRERGTRQQRGYDADYDARRKQDTRALANGVVLTCWRCNNVVMPHNYSLGHCDDDRTIIHGAEHLTQCNLANTRGDCPHASHRDIPPVA